MRILDVINKTTPFFTEHGVESPRLNIELMLAHVLGKRRLDLYLEFEREVDEPVLVRLREMVKRRSAGEPLQYILGETEFCGLKIAVDRRVLIPRPETELLVEEIKKLGGPTERPLRIIDLCTGSGCIAVALARQLPHAEIWAVDNSLDSLAVAQTNIKIHGLEKRIRFFAGDLLSAVNNSFKAEVIVSNPPYIASGDWAKLAKEVKDFEPVQALVAGEDGLKFYRRILADASGFLLPQGVLCLELGDGQRTAVESLCGQYQLKVDRVLQDLQGHDRVLVARPA